MAMIAKAAAIDFVLTPSDRDALILESNLIKHHQPPYNVLLRDDESYPYICASVGDAFPRFFPTPRRQTGDNASKYRYFGPYPHFKEINAVLDGIEEQYDLRAKSFEARHGDYCKEEYANLFNLAMAEVFESKSSNTLIAMRSEYEEAKLLFKSTGNRCRHVACCHWQDRY
jgi:excinuclease UvrABC nuclease subunit